MPRRLLAASYTSWEAAGPSPARRGSLPAIALYFQVPWDRANDRHQFQLDLVDSDGVAVRNANNEPIVVGGAFESGRPAGLRAGTPLDVALAINLPPLPLEPDGRYEWRLTMNGEGHDNWRLAFSTRPGVPSEPLG